jgi:hypothetical protein
MKDPFWVGSASDGRCGSLGTGQHQREEELKRERLRYRQ